MKKEKDSMRVLILGIDALEYNRVEEWDLKHLKQAEYGKTIVPLTEIKGENEPATVIVWPCFITGEEPKRMGYDNIKIRENDWLDELYCKVKSRFPKSERIFKYLHRKSKKTKRTRNDIKVPTMFENPNIKSVHLHIPVYDNDAFPEYRGIGTFRAVGDTNYRKLYEEGCKQEFKKRTQEVFNLLNNSSWDLAMQYFFLLDGIQHVFFNNKLKVMEYYMMFNDFVGKLKDCLPDNVMLLIISDHGQEKGLHTNYGFYSCDRKLGLDDKDLDYPKIIDFKKIVEKQILQN